MSRNTFVHTALLVVSVAGCGVDLEDAPPVDNEPIAAARKPVDPESCPDYVCGKNSPNLDSFPVRQIDLTAPTADGFSIAGAYVGNQAFALSVSHGRVSATAVNNAANVLSDVNLVGLRVIIRHATTTSPPTYYTVLFQNVDHAVQYSLPNAAGVRPHLESYQLSWQPTPNNPNAQLSSLRPFCPMPPVWGYDPDTRMPASNALVYEGEVYERPYTVDAETRPEMITFACADTTFFKMATRGYTDMARADNYPATTTGERTALFKSFAANYCPNFVGTVAGQPLDWFDGKIQNGNGPHLEARWNAQGAACLNTPRVVFHPTADSNAVFGLNGANLAAQMAAAGCTVPACPDDNVHALGVGTINTINR